MTATPIPLRDLPAKWRNRYEEAKALGVPDFTRSMRIFALLADELEAALSADGEDRARKLYEPDEYEDAFKGRATPPASGPGRMNTRRRTPCRA